MHPERVVIARVSAVVVAVVAIIIVVTAVVVAVAVGAFGIFSLGTSSQMYKSLSSLPAAAHELGLRSSE
jgi:thiol:disulfide interchange protein